jgi:hypothetical protein
MKRIFLPIVSMLIASNIFAAPISYDDAKRARGGVPMYDVITLSKDLDQHRGQLIAVLCHLRGKDIHHLKPSWYEGSISEADPEKKGQFATVRVMIAKKDLDTFKSIPTSASGGATVLQGRVEHDAQANFSFLRLIYSNAPRNTSAHP